MPEAFRVWRLSFKINQETVSLLKVSKMVPKATFHETKTKLSKQNQNL